MTEVIYPFLEKIGILWQTQNITPAHEHYISNLIRQKVIVADRWTSPSAQNCTARSAFSSGAEMHEIGLLFYHYLTRKAGNRTYYLGQSVPHSDLVQVVKFINPKFSSPQLLLLCLSRSRLILEDSPKISPTRSSWHPGYRCTNTKG